MRHRTYKQEHLPASLRPTVAAAMVRLLEARSGQLVVDPMCGAGTILGEQLVLGRHHREARARILGADRNLAALWTAEANLRGLGPSSLLCWDARRLPLATESVDRLVSNPPFGKQLGRPQEIEPLYQRMAVEYNRVLRPQGRAVLLAADFRALKEAARDVSWKQLRQVRVRVLGQKATISLWRKD
jgi:23S rRNA G2445 N2-methylase RlmL